MSGGVLEANCSKQSLERGNLGVPWPGSSSLHLIGLNPKVERDGVRWFVSGLGSLLSIA